MIRPETFLWLVGALALPFAGCAHSARHTIPTVPLISTIPAKQPIPVTLPTPEECTGVPLLENPCFWQTHAGQESISCEYSRCFPKDIGAEIGCAPRCLLTVNGFGEPEAVHRAFEGKSPVRGATPTFFVAYGPPASGKSRIVPVLRDRIPEEFGQLDEPVSVNVDDIFESGEVGALYKTYRRQIIDRYGDRSERYTQRLYFYLRWVADQISDSILNRALAGHYNVLWETTGQSDWPAHEIGRISSYGYRTVVAYPLASTKTLIERARLRAETDGQEAPPLDRMNQMVESSQTHLIDILPAGVELRRPACPADAQFERGPHGCRAGRVILIDNTRARGRERITLDTDTPNAHCEALESVIAAVSLEPSLVEALLHYATACRGSP